MEKLYIIELGTRMGLEGPELLNFVSEQQVIQREERAKECELQMIEIEQKARSVRLRWKLKNLQPRSQRETLNESMDLKTSLSI